MQGARSAEPETIRKDRRGGEHRATPQAASAVVLLGNPEQEPHRQQQNNGQGEQGRDRRMEAEEQSRITESLVEVVIGNADDRAEGYPPPLIGFAHRPEHEGE